MPLYSFLSGFISALIAAVISSFAGGGSNLILFPLLLLISGGTYAASLGIAKASASVLTIVAGNVHRKRHTFDLRLLIVIIVSSLLGTAVGTYWLRFHFDEALFKRLLAMILISTAAYLFLSKEKGMNKNAIPAVSRWKLVVTALYVFALNILNSLFGGTGIFLTVFLMGFLGMSFIHAIAFSMISYITVSVIQAAYLLFTEKFDPWLLAGVMLGALVGSWLGTKLLYFKGNRWAKMAAMIMMLIIAVQMLLGAS